MNKKHCCRVCEPDSGYDVEMIKIEEEKRREKLMSKVMIFDYKSIVNDKICLLLKGKKFGVVFDYSGVPQSYTDCLDKHKVPWRKEKKGLSNVSVAEEGLNLVFKWFKKTGKRFELKGKNALVIGSEGHIGKSVCKILRGFGCHVLDYDIIIRKRRHLDFWLEFAELIFICTPELNSYLLSEKEFGLMKACPLIVNVSGRVSLVNEKVLHEYLDKGLVKGYTCDEQSKAHKKCFYQVHQGTKTIEAIKRRKLEKQKNIKVLSTNIN